MRPPTGNPITQTMHGQYNAVDYAYIPDIYVYAPEDLSWYAYIPNAGDAGNNLQMTGATGRHGFCHLEEIYLTPGQGAKKGEKIAKMGYTGRTDPVGPEGRHLHWVIFTKDGYVYPPDLITEPFGGDDMAMPNEGFLYALHRIAFGWPATDEWVNNYMKSGKDIFKIMDEVAVYAIEHGQANENYQQKLRQLIDSLPDDAALGRTIRELVTKGNK